MKYTSIVILSILFLGSCELEGVKTSEVSAKEKDAEEVEVAEESKKNIEIVDNQVYEEASDTLRLDNGIVITYFKKGTGKKLQKGDMIKIDYRMKLENGKVYDGNHLIKKPSIPFLVGWNQQTPGWDIALKELRVGDDVDIFLPAEYARGELGIPGLVPPNENNILSIRIIEEFLPMKEGDGIRIWKYDELKEPGDSIGFEDVVYLNYWVSSESNPRYDSSYKKGEVFKLVMGDGNIVPGLYKALYFAREGDRIMVTIPPSEAYGDKGLVDIVKPNESLFYDLQIAKVIKK